MPPRRPDNSSKVLGKRPIRREARAQRAEGDRPLRPPPGLERIYGKHPVRAVLLARPSAARRLLIARDESFHEELAALAERAGVKPDYLDWADFLQAGGFARDERHQGVLLFAEPRLVYSERDFDRLETARTILALDQISDPQNLSTMMRCAAFFGIDAIIILRDRSADITSDVVRHSVGGVEFVDVFRVTNLSQSLAALKDYGFTVIGLDERGEKTLAQTRFDEKTVLVVGAEGDGLRVKTKRYCDRLVRIPGGRPGVESLNAGVATAIALAEIHRDRDIVP
jgi:23S rRNA (guanosine2251-2'-O)-methyltransferase